MTSKHEYIFRSHVHRIWNDINVKVIKYFNVSVVSLLLAAGNEMTLQGTYQIMCDIARNL